MNNIKQGETTVVCRKKRCFSTLIERLQLHPGDIKGGFSGQFFGVKMIDSLCENLRRVTTRIKARMGSGGP